ncbi:MAG: type 1 glutamine amidotransferase [Pseudomonadota bacterium]
MKLTIVETGLVPEPIRADWPDYPDMFEALIAPAAPDFTFETVSPIKGERLPDPASLDAVLVTGSKAGIYDDEPWIPPLLDFIRWAAAEKTPQVGICFGHQAIAQALGGQVIKSPKGWGIGRHSYAVTHTGPVTMEWLTPAPDTLALAVSHQDQVVVPPPGAIPLVSSDFAPHAGLVYAQGSAMSLQGHPEFSPGFSNALYRARLGSPLTAAQVETATESFADPLDAPIAAQWIANFLHAHAKPKE